MTDHTLVRGTKEYLDVTVSADIELDGTVEFSFDRTTWVAAAWQGDEATTRTARYLLDTEDMERSSYPVYVRFTDVPEIPILRAGTLFLR